MKHEHSMPSGPVDFPEELKREIEGVESAITNPVLKELLVDIREANAELKIGKITAREASTMVRALDERLIAKRLMHSPMTVTGQLTLYSGVAQGTGGVEVLLPAGADEFKTPVEDSCMICRGFIVETSDERGSKIKLLAGGSAKPNEIVELKEMRTEYGIDLDEAIITQLGPITFEQSKGLLEQFNPDLAEIINKRIKAVTAKESDSSDRIKALYGIDVSSVSAERDGGRAAVALERYVNELANPDLSVPYLAEGYAVTERGSMCPEPLVSLFAIDAIKILPVRELDGTVSSELCVGGYALGPELDEKYLVYYPIDLLNSLVSIRTKFYRNSL